MTFITRMMFLDEVAYPVFVPQNEGMLRPVNVIAPKGSIFNPNFPRACFARFCQVQRAVDLALRALSPIASREDHRRQLGAPALHRLLGLREGRGRVLGLPRGRRGFLRRAPDTDGLDSVDCLIANTRNNPIEELEWRYPMRTERYELRDDAVRGRQVARRHRHGARPTASSWTRSSPARASASSRTRRGASSAATMGQRARPISNPGQPDEESWPSKFTGHRSRPATRIEITVPNSGGYGDPLERDPELVLSDVLDGFTTLERAERDYGVVIDARPQAGRRRRDAASARAGPRRRRSARY